MSSPKKTAALIAAFAGAVVASSSTLATKIAVREIAPVHLGALRYAIGALCMVLYLVASGTSLKMLLIRPRDLPRLASTGLLTLVIQAVAIATALKYTSASRVAVLFSTSSLWTILFSAFRGGGQTSVLQIVGVVASIAGIAVITTPTSASAGGPSEVIGALLVVLAAVGMASGSMIQQRLMARYNLFVVTFYRIAVSALVLIVAGLIMQPTAFVTVFQASREALIALVYLGVMGGAVMYMLWGFSLSRLSATQCLVFMNLQPFMVTAVAVLFMGEVLTTTFLVGGVAIIGGVVLSQLPSRRPKIAPATAAAPR